MQGDQVHSSGHEECFFGDVEGPRASRPSRNEDPRKNKLPLLKIEETSSKLEFLVRFNFENTSAYRSYSTILISA